MGFLFWYDATTSPEERSHSVLGAGPEGRDDPKAGSEDGGGRGVARASLIARKERAA
jgi:hypothetical protein